MTQIEYVFLAYTAATFLLGSLTYALLRRDQKLRRLLKGQNDS